MVTRQVRGEVDKTGRTINRNVLHATSNSMTSLFEHIDGTLTRSSFAPTVLRCCGFLSWFWLDLACIPSLSAPLLCHALSSFLSLGSIRSPPIQTLRIVLLVSLRCSFSPFYTRSLSIYTCTRNQKTDGLSTFFHCLPLSSHAGNFIPAPTRINSNFQPSSLYSGHFLVKIPSR